VSVVADASPLIALNQVGRLDTLRQLVGEVLVPPAVAAEILPSVPAVAWIVVRRPAKPVTLSAQRASLGAGEVEALGLALELQATHFIVDERAARREAIALGLRPLGTLGVLLAAKRRGLIPEIKPLIDELVRQGFWVSPRLVKATLAAAGEA